MSTKKRVTNHRADGEHTRKIETSQPDGSRTITEQKVVDTPVGELGASNTRVTKIDSDGNSTTKAS